MERAVLARIAKEWLAHLEHERHLAPSSVATYKSTLTQVIGQLPPTYTEEDLQAALSTRLMPPASSHVRRATFVHMNSFFEWRWGRTGQLNPLRDMEAPRRPEVRRRPFNDEEIRVLEYRLMLAEIKDRCEVLLMIEQGFRVGSVCSIKVSDVDFAGERIRVKGKGGLDKWMPMGPPMAEALAEYMGQLGITDGYLFPGRRGKMTGRAIWQAWQRVAGRVYDPALIPPGAPELRDLRHLKPHQLRHTFAHALSRKTGAHLQDVMNLLGHRDLRTTQMYLAEDPESQRAAILKLPSALGWTRRAPSRARRPPHIDR